VFLDFDGTLAEIAPTPDDVKPAPGAVDVLSALVPRYAIVAIVTGRPGADIGRFLPVDGLEVFGVYGLEHAREAGSPRAFLPHLTRIAALVPGAWVEDKGVSLTLHYRLTSDPDEAEEVILPEVQDLARREGLSLLEGKRAVEISLEAVPGKGAVISGEVQARGLEVALYAGDDLADLDAFAALEGLRDEGVETVKVGVRSEETPEVLLERADLVVDRPAGLVTLLRQLAG
jgi:trehalose 6-phosphate phosphatase